MDTVCQTFPVLLHRRRTIWLSSHRRIFNPTTALYRTKHGDRPTGSIGYGRAHYYDLPWPTEILEELENTEVKLKVTFSYFVEPYPVAGSMLDPARYRSFGLRFDLKRKRETEAQFQGRKNAAAGRRVTGDAGDEGWLFGERAVAAGSLHSDVWSGPAVELAARDQLCIYPVMGWWRDRSEPGALSRQSSLFARDLA